MHGRSMFTRIVAIVIVIIMVLSVGFVTIRSFAAGAETAVLTGGQAQKWPAVVGIGAVALIILCVAIPKISSARNKNQNNDSTDKKD